MKRLRFGGGDSNTDSVDVAGVLMLLSRGGDDHVVEAKAATTSSSSDRVFECKTCSRRFGSFQALGGHRASHKKPRLVDGGGAHVGKRPRVHECSVCGLEFGIGQALGGHMRRHRAAGVVVDGGKKRVWLDLNLPPPSPENEMECIVDPIHCFY